MSMGKETSEKQKKKDELFFTDERTLSSLFPIFLLCNHSYILRDPGTDNQGDAKQNECEIGANENLPFNLSFASISPLVLFRVTSSISHWVSEDALAQPSCKRCSLTLSCQQAPLTGPCTKTRNTGTPENPHFGLGLEDFGWWLGFG